MVVAVDQLPSDPERLRAIIAEQAAALAAKEAELHARNLLVEKLKAQLAVLRRARFGTSSEKLERSIAQLELALRGVALGRKNWLFAGSDRGGDRFADRDGEAQGARPRGLSAGRADPHCRSPGQAGRRASALELERRMSDGLSKKLRQLDDFLLSEAVDDDAMLLSELDGFLAGLIVCPGPIMPSEWLPVVWGEDGPVFEDEHQAQAIINLIMGHYNDIVRGLDRSRHRPLYDLDADDSILWETWIEGFWRAVQLRPEAWLELSTNDDEDLQTAVFSLSRLYEIAATSPTELQVMEIDEELEELAPGMIPHAVEILHRARLAQAGSMPASAKTAIPKWVATNYVLAAPARNSRTA